jgi:hypothetical protein
MKYIDTERNVFFNMKKRKASISNFLTHEYSNFTEYNIANEANYYGINNKSILERHFWIYEFHSKLQHRLKERTILKGGACAQLYLPVATQRCTEDLDLYTNLNSKELKSEFNSLIKEFNINKIQSKAQEYIPRSVQLHGKTMPITTFIVKLPFIYRENRKSGVSQLKVDFLHVDTNRLKINHLDKRSTLGLGLRYNPLCISLHSIIGAKLLTFGANTVGIENFKKDKHYKNIYDVFYLINENNDVDTLIGVSNYIKDNISLEFKVKGIEPIKILTILEDMIKQLYFLAVEDLRRSYMGPSVRIIIFQQNYIRQNINDDLDQDQWSIMAMYLLIWTHALKNYVISGNFSELQLFNDIIEEYDSFNNLSDKEQIKYINNMKDKLRSKKETFILDVINEPLRLIFLYFIFYNLKD